MQILRTNLDGTDPQQTEIFFAEPGAASAYLQYAKDTSAEGSLIIVGEGFDNPPGRKTINIVAISGVIQMDNIAQ